MEGVQQSSNIPAPFLTKTYEMVNDPMTNLLVSWSDSGCSFVVWDAIDFSTQLLPIYFKHNNFSSFVRQLNTYGFRKVDPDRWEYANEEFLRGESYRLLCISRRKPIHSHSAQFQAALTEKGRQEYEEKIKSLKNENSLFQLELQKQRKDKQEFELQVKSSCERLRNLECKQIQLIGFVAKAIENPGFASTPLSQLDTCEKKRRLLTPCLFSYEGSQNEMDVPKLELKQLERLECSLEIWENLLDGIQYSAARSAMPNFNVSPQNCGVIAEKPGNKACEPCSRRSLLSSPGLYGVSSSPDVVQSMDDVDSDVPFMYAQSSEIRLSCCVIDTTWKPGEREDEESTKEAAASIGVNDQFWEQFLTETPAGLWDSPAAAIHSGLGRGAWMTA